MKPDDIDKMRTFPKKPNPIGAFSSGNKFQKMAAVHKEQEQSGRFYGDQRKIHFGGTPKMQYREGGKFYKPPRNEEVDSAKKGKFAAGKSGKFADKKNGKPGKSSNSEGNKKKKVKKVKGDPVKGTSTEYAQLANSDEDEEDIVDVSDMLEEPEEPEEEMDSEIPLINTSKVMRKSTAASKKNRFSALGHYEDEEEDDDAPPPSKKSKLEDSDEEDSDAAPEEVQGSEDEESEDDESERLKFREEIAQMPIGKIREMKEKLGIKLFNKTYFGTSEVEKKRQEEKKKSIAEASEKGGQHRPKEISSKRQISTFRNIYGDHEKGTKKKRWDPRFDTRAGDFKEVCFENNYQFLDEIRSGEMQDLRNEYNTARGEGDEKKAARLKNTIQKMETREKTRAEKRRQAETRKELHDDNIERMLRGEAPIFRTKAQVRRIDAEKKYEELKKDNKLDKYLQRKAKKESAKQKKARPFEGYGFQN